MKYNGEFGATILVDKLIHMQNQDPHWAFTSQAAMFTDAILMFAIGFCIRMICC
jgi:hypothetical protein